MPATSHLPQQQLNVPHPICAALVLKMKLKDFCDRFDLSVTILQKLDTLKVASPHALRFVSDTQLVGNRGMDIGELADVRDAQEQWTLGKGKMTDCLHCHLYFFVIVLMFLEIMPLTVGYRLTVLISE